MLNYANKPVKNPDSFQVNTSLQRCLAKAISLHGLGVHIYSGEDIADIPTEVENPKEIQKTEVKKVEEQVKKVEEKTSKPDTLKIDVPDKGSSRKWIPMSISKKSESMARRS